MELGTQTWFKNRDPIHKANPNRITIAEVQTVCSIASSRRNIVILLTNKFVGSFSVTCEGRLVRVTSTHNNEIFTVTVTCENNLVLKI